MSFSMKLAIAAVSMAWFARSVSGRYVWPIHSSNSIIKQRDTSPQYPFIFGKPLPIPAIAQPIFTGVYSGRQIQYYELTIENFNQQVYPNLGPAHMIGYNGTAPGPTFYIQRGTEAVVRYLNNGNSSASVHLHGSNTQSVWDGWASDKIKPGQYKDYYYPNSESARPMWYHDHVLGATSTDVLLGQAGCWIIYDPAEDALGLPSGKYDVPLAIIDKSYQWNGDLVWPQNNLTGFYGDVIEVNGQPWPYFSVEPRKYRLRFFQMSLSRPYSLYFQTSLLKRMSFQVIASDSGLFAAPVTTSSLTISPGERYEVVLDFSQYQGQNITLKNEFTLLMPLLSNTDKVMRFVVGNHVTNSSNNGAVPSSLDSNIAWPPSRTTIDQVFNFQSGGNATWTINGVDFNNVNNRVLARPPQGTVERWQLNHVGAAEFHPVHIHLVNMQVVSRKNSTRGLLPYETAGLKDVVLLEPGETVEVLAVYGPWNGLYMFHCHNLVHEDNLMLDAFNTTKLQQLGYNTSADFGDPTNPLFAAQKYNPAAFDVAAANNAVASLAALNPYGAASSLAAAESKYYDSHQSVQTQSPADVHSQTPSVTAGPSSTSSSNSRSTSKTTSSAPPLLSGLLI